MPSTVMVGDLTSGACTAASAARVRLTGADRLTEGYGHFAVTTPELDLSSPMSQPNTQGEGRQFDVVYTGKGALGHLPDLARWAAVVAQLLRPGGRLMVRTPSGWCRLPEPRIPLLYGLPADR